MITRLLAFAVACYLLACTAAAAEQPSYDYLNTVKIMDVVTAVFEQYPGELWPGYDLTQEPYIAYTPGDFALLANPGAIAPLDEFGAFPDGWPAPVVDAQYLAGSFRDLTGQLRFDLPWDPYPAVAVPFNWAMFSELTPAEVNLEFLGFLFHEPFHQFQHENFGEFTYRPERSYPIDNAENNALICLEMNLLRDAIDASIANDRELCEDLTRMFIAVREHRWEIAGEFVVAFEQGLELNEGTAKYVELRGLEKFMQLPEDAPENELRQQAHELLKQMGYDSVPALMAKEFGRHFTGASIKPSAVPRNRVYPTGAAQCMLLDYFEADWKPVVQQAGPETTYAGLLKEQLGPSEFTDDELISKAQQSYHYDVILQETEALLAQFFQDYEENLCAFYAQDSLRIEITLSTNGVATGQNNSNRVWTIGQGADTLMEKVYLRTFNDDDLEINIRDTGVFEQRDLETKLVTVAVYPGSVESLAVDGIELAIEDVQELSFNSLKLKCEHMGVDYSGNGEAQYSDGVLKINLCNH